MLKRINIAAVATFLLMAAGCSDLNEIKDRLDSAESRLEALETQIDILKGNLETLTKLKEYHTIKAVDFDESKNTYEITLTNGEKLSLYQGSVGFYSPIMTIDEEGYWKMSLTNADGEVIEDTYVLNNNGEKVSAVGEKGITPQFRVDDHENWEVSYDEGTTWTDVLNEAGEAVKATPDDSADNYFKSVNIENGNLVIEMKDKANSVISLPILGNFYFIIKDDNGNDINDLQFFTLGETKKYQIDQSDISEVTVLTCPAGFSANINGDLLEITAAASTKSLVADSGRDITFLASSASNPGLFTMEKIQVEKTTDPIVMISKKDAGLASLTFNVKMYNSEGYFFIIRPADDPGATSEDILAGTYSAETQLTVEGLRPETEYILYVMSTAGEDSYSDIAKIQATTSAITSYYEAYLAGVDIEIAGIKINTTTAPTYLSDETANINKNGVYFISEKTKVELQNKSYDDLYIIGDTPGKKGTIKIIGNTRWNTGKTFGLKNIKIDAGETPDFTMLQANGDNGTILLESCALENNTTKDHIIFTNKPTSIYIHGCDIKISGDGKGVINTNTGATTTLSVINNIFYSVEDRYKFMVVNGQGTVSSLIVNNNTFANVYNFTATKNGDNYTISDNNNGYFKTSDISNGEVKNNLVLTPNYDNFGNAYTLFVKEKPDTCTCDGNMHLKSVNNNRMKIYTTPSQGTDLYMDKSTKIEDVVEGIPVYEPTPIIVTKGNYGAKR